MGLYRRPADQEGERIGAPASYCENAAPTGSNAHAFRQPASSAPQGSASLRLACAGARNPRRQTSPLAPRGQIGTPVFRPAQPAAAGGWPSRQTGASKRVRQRQFGIGGSANQRGQTRLYPAAKGNAGLKTGARRRADGPSPGASSAPPGEHQSPTGIARERETSAGQTRLYPAAKGNAGLQTGTARRRRADGPSPTRVKRAARGTPTSGCSTAGPRYCDMFVVSRPTSATCVSGRPRQCDMFVVSRPG